MITATKQRAFANMVDGASLETSHTLNCATCGKKLWPPAPVLSVEINTLKAKWLEPECYEGCQSLMWRHLVEELVAVGEAVLKVGPFSQIINPKSVQVWGAMQDAINKAKTKL